MVMREVEMLANQRLCSDFACLESNSTYANTVYTSYLFYLHNVRKCQRVDATFSV